MRALPSQDILKELLEYYPKTGVLIWKERKAEHFTNTESQSAEHAANSWNRRLAGKMALHSVLQGRYRTGSLLNQPCRAHRVIWKLVTGEDPIEIDHIDGNGLNNRWRNLRSVGMAINGRNLKRCKRNTSGVTGVTWKPTLNKWRVRAMVDGVEHHVGLYTSLEEAATARKKFGRKHGFHRNHGRAANA